MSLLSEQQITNLRRYQYHGGDPSLLYRYVLSPLADYMVHQWTPSSIAPNMITFGGLVISAMAMVITLVVNPELDHSNPSWLSILIGLSILIYQTMDNMDGKFLRLSLNMMLIHTDDGLSEPLTCRQAS
jgi:ethanolaminephosphotransferase